MSQGYGRPRLIGMRQRHAELINLRHSELVNMSIGMYIWNTLIDIWENLESLCTISSTPYKINVLLYNNNYFHSLLTLLS